MNRLFSLGVLNLACLAFAGCESAAPPVRPEAGQAQEGSGTSNPDADGNGGEQDTHGSDSR